MRRNRRLSRVGEISLHLDRLRFSVTSRQTQLVTVFLFMTTVLFHNGQIVLSHQILLDGAVLVRDGRIEAVDARPGERSADQVVDLGGGYLVPGFIDVHIHGGDGADFMDGTEEAFRTVCRAHARHGTTSLLPTTTVARHEQHLAFLGVCKRLMASEGRQPPVVNEPSQAHGPRGANAPRSPGVRILGAHFYGPYFGLEARGCHPADPVRPPRPEEYLQYLDAGCICTATVAPELPGAEQFVRDCRARGIRCNAGHSHATFEQMEAAVGWGVRHIDHLFCAMSDRARLRQTQTYPMRGGVMEATLFFDELTTEVIADGKHLCRELLLLAYKVKGPDRVALCTDCNRALDRPDGEYIFGPTEGGEKILRQDGVGLMADGTALASGVEGMDHMVRTFHQLTGVPLVEVVRMASLTPARVAGWDDRIGSIAVGKLADLVVLDRELKVREVYIGGDRV